MAKADIYPGNCGLRTSVEAQMNGSDQVDLNIESECAHIRKLSADLPSVEPWSQLSFRQGVPVVLEKGHQYCTHAACPVPVGILKAVEVAAGSALPDTVTIEVSSD